MSAKSELGHLGERVEAVLNGNLDMFIEKEIVSYNIK